MPYHPSVSIIIPVYNSASCIGLCLEGIRKQNYPKDKIEIIIIDAGSTDSTLDIVRKYGVDKILKNPLKTGEAGKSVGAQYAQNDIIALIDSDNIIEDENWLERMTAPFADNDIVGSEPIRYSYRYSDPIITRYCALLGMNDPICYYFGNYDRISQLSGKWTGLNIPTEEKNGYIKIDLEGYDLYPTIGANGFLIRRELLLKTHYKPYLFDIDLVSELVPLGYSKYAKVDIGIVHLYARDLKDFARKQERRVKDYIYYRDKQQRYYPWDKISIAKRLKFIMLTLLVIPLLWDIWKGYKKIADKAWWFHIPACWTTLLVYGISRIMLLFPSNREIADRNNWNR